MDTLEVPLHGQCGAHPSQGRVFLSHHLPQAGVQVHQLLMESSAELLQEVVSQAAEERSVWKRLKLC